MCKRVCSIRAEEPHRQRDTTFRRISNVLPFCQRLKVFLSYPIEQLWIFVVLKDWKYPCSLARHVQRDVSSHALCVLVVLFFSLHIRDGHSIRSESIRWHTDTTWITIVEILSCFFDAVGRSVTIVSRQRYNILLHGICSLFSFCVPSTFRVAGIGSFPTND